MKKDISYISETDTNNLLSQIKNLKLTKYHYKTESGSNPLRLGLIAEDSPPEILSANSKGIDLYKLTAMAIGGIQSQQKQIEQLTNKVLGLEKSITLNTYGDVQIQKDTNKYLGDYETVKSGLLSQTYNVLSKTGEVINQVIDNFQLFAGKIKTGLLEAENIVVNNTLAAKNAVIEQLNVVSENVASLAVGNKITSPIVETNTLQVNNEAQIPHLETNEIKPENKEVSINLSENNDVQKGELSKLIIKGLNGKKAIEMDAVGNATFSGTLASNKLETNEASISGKLVAKEIESENINSLTRELSNTQNNLSNISSKSGELETDMNEVQKLLADLKNQPLPNIDSYQTILQDMTIPASQSGQIAYSDNMIFENISSTGTTNLYTAYVSNNITIGNVFIEKNKISALDFELKLTALSSINLLDGEVIISRTGGLTTKGTLTAKAGIKTGKIEPLNENENVFIKNLETNEINISDKYLEATNSGVIISAPDNFEKNKLYAPAIETKAQTAGNGIIKSQDEEIVIYNESIKEDSLVYLTPTDNPQNNTITLVKKEICGLEAQEQSNQCKPYFKVISNNKDHDDIKFNWLIIN
jgi:hypothetical protein